MRKYISIGLSAATLALLLSFSSCGNSSNSNTTEDTSASGSVASAIGGGLQGSSGGTTSMLEQAPRYAKIFDLESLFSNAYASNATCPTIPTTAQGAGCSVSGFIATLTYSNCSFANAAATWSGSQTVTFTGVAPVCGSAFPTTQTAVTRGFAANTTRSTGTSSGTVVTLDTNGLYSAWDGTSVTGGYTTTWSGGVPTSFKINGINLVAATSSGTRLWKHSITSSTLTVTGGNTIPAGSSLTFWHDYAQVKATSVVTTALVFNSSSCTPVSGTITTTYSTGAASGYSKYNGAVETLTFTGAGTATYSGPEGANGNVTLAHCF